MTVLESVHVVETGRAVGVVGRTEVAVFFATAVAVAGIGVTVAADGVNGINVAVLTRCVVGSRVRHDYGILRTHEPLRPRSH